jgi:hypothetical protein
MSRDARRLQQIVAEYQTAGMPWPATKHEIAEWAIETKRWGLLPADKVQVCANQLARAMREEYIDVNGHRVRRKHSVAVKRDGRRTQIWDNFETASFNHMELSLKQRRNQIVGDCRQLKTDADAYNEMHPDGPQLYLPLNFTQDVAELEAAAQ